MIRVSTICKNCGKEFLKLLRSSNPTAYRPVFCSKLCQGEWQSINFKGELNPNFGKKWNDEQKLKQSEIVKSKVNDEYRRKAGSANRGVKFSPERIKAMHINRTRESYSHPHSDKIKKVIGRKSREKFTDEFKKRMREVNEQNGRWVPLKDKTDWEIYKEESNWIDKMYNFITDESQLCLLNEYKVFHATENNTGVVRDHRYSRWDGYLNKVYPEILRHPVNCFIMLHSDNISKGSKSLFTLDELFNNIRQYTGMWQEQNRCLTLIKEYKMGNRWKRKEVSDDK